MKTNTRLVDLRTYVVFVAAVMFAVLFSSCEEPEPVVPDLPKLPTVQTVSVTEVAAGIVMVSAEIVSDGGEEVIGAGICWVQNGVPTIYNDTVAANIKTGSFDCLVQGLKNEPGVSGVYYFRAYAISKNGTNYGNKLWFNPASTKLVKPVAIIEPVVNETMTSATIAAVLIPKQSDTKASFEYRDIADTSWITVPLTLNLEGVDLKDSIMLTVDLSGLMNGAKYLFRLKANNSAGEVVSTEGRFSTYAVSDIDGNLYHSVKIGDQIWLQENLKTTRYANGDAIANVTDPATWGSLTTGAYCWYNNDPELGNIYGGLYNFYVGVDERGLIPGYHVPTYEEWRGILDFLGDWSQGGTVEVRAAVAMRETGTKHWLTESTPPSTNSSGFTALPGGALTVIDVTYQYVFAALGSDAVFWSVTLFGPGADKAGIDGMLQTAALDFQNAGLSLRLIKDAK